MATDEQEESFEPEIDRHNRFVDAAIIITSGLITAYFAKQAKRAIANMKKSLSADDVYSGVNEFRELEILRGVIRPALTTIASASTADLVWRVTPGFDPDVDQLGRWAKMEKAGYEFPRDVRLAIRGRVDEQLEGSYFGKTAMGTFDAAGEGVKQLVAAGKTMADAIDEVEQKINDAIPARSERIAETESNCAINQGNQTGARILTTTGMAENKTWVTMADELVRAAHDAKHGEVIPVDNLWVLAGGYTCPHPGHWQLPIHLRIHCRCFQIVGFSITELDAIPQSLRITV